MRNLIGVKLVSLTHLPCINCLPQNQRWKFWLSWFHSLDAWFQLWSELEILILHLFYLFIHSFINFLLSEGRGGVGDLYGVERFSATINNWFIRQRASYLDERTADVSTNCFITFSTQWNFFSSRDLFADVMSVHNRSVKHARAIEFD